VHAVPGRPQGAPRPDQGVVLHRLGQHEVAARPQDPPHLGQHPGRLLQMVQDVDAPHQADTGVGQGQAGAVGHRYRRLGEGLGGAVPVVLDPDRLQAGGAHPPQPVPPAATEVQDRARAPELPQMTFEPRVEGLVDIGCRVLPRARRQDGHSPSPVPPSSTRAQAKPMPASPETPKTTPIHRAGPGSAGGGASGATVVVELPSVTQAVGGARPGGAHAGAWAYAAAGAPGPRRRNAATAPATRIVRTVTTSQTNLPALPGLQSLPLTAAHPDRSRSCAGRRPEPSRAVGVCL